MMRIIIRMIKARRMRWAGHVARMGRKKKKKKKEEEEESSYRLLVGKPEEKNDWEDEDIGGWIMLKWILENEDWGVWTGFV
jgi:hypothetical protein